MKKVVIILLILPLLFSCHKTKTYYMSQNLKDYFLFGKNSYWIYKDEQSSTIDSTYVIKSVVSVYHSAEMSDGQEMVNIDFKGIFIKDIVAIASADGSGGISAISFDSISGKPGPESTYKEAIDIGDSITAFNNGYENYKYFHFSNLNINNRNYSNVLLLKYVNLQTQYEWNIYIAKHVGIIKYYIKTNNQTFHYTLLRSSVYQ